MLLTTACVRTFIAREPNSSAAVVSDASPPDGETHTTRDVRQLPPSASDSMCVSFESRYGMCVACVDSAFITLDSPRSDVLMWIASFIRLPLVSSSAPLFFGRSRRTRKVDDRQLARGQRRDARPRVQPMHAALHRRPQPRPRPDAPSRTRSRQETWSCNTECERDECLFIFVSAYTRARAKVEESQQLARRLALNRGVVHPLRAPSQLDASRLVRARVEEVVDLLE